MRWLAGFLAVTSFASTPALAQLDGGVIKVQKAAKPLPPKGLGSAKEDDDEPVKSAQAPLTGPGATSDADSALLRGVLFAFEPAPTEIRVIAIEDLGILGDSRALNPLAQLVMDANPTVQLAALKAIGSIRHPRAEAILANVVRHPTLGDRTKLAAVDAILFQNSSSSVAFLSFLATAPGFNPALQQQARRALGELPPGRSR
ncbi:MAG: HEAT repeat domain-containing protein [Myxococcaceae bacterium]|nr:HEAT repeat domain-containing protein [Myxococcaceae bacterium]